VKNKLGDSGGGEKDKGPVLEMMVDDCGKEEEVTGCGQWRQRIHRIDVKAEVNESQNLSRTNKEKNSV
jgi:hypothetical protein